MRLSIIVVCMIFLMGHALFAANYYPCYPGESVYYPNGYCATCDQGPQPDYYPSAPACGTCCGLSACSVALAIAAVVGVAILVASIGNESAHFAHPPVI